MARIFISYSRKDEPFARRLAADLDGLGADVWIDVDDIPAGMNWSRAIQQGLDSCDVMIVVISPDSMESANVENEWQYSLDHGCPIIPVLWRPARVHFQLHRLQYIDFHAQDYDKAFQQLLSALRHNGVVFVPLAAMSFAESREERESKEEEPDRRARVPRAYWVIGAVIALIVVAILVALSGVFGNGGEADEDAVATRVVAKWQTQTATALTPPPTETLPPSATNTFEPTETPLPTNTPQPSATVTAEPTNTLLPTITPAPTEEPTEMPKSTDEAVTAESAAADSAAGEELFAAICYACHGEQDGAGPSQIGMGERAATRVEGQPAEEYLYESIVDPSAFVVEGYSDIMPHNFSELLSARELSDLVAYLLTEVTQSATEESAPELTVEADAAGTPESAAEATEESATEATTPEPAGESTPEAAGTEISAVPAEKWMEMAPGQLLYASNPGAFIQYAALSLDEFAASVGLVAAEGEAAPSLEDVLVAIRGDLEAQIATNGIAVEEDALQGPLTEAINGVAFVYLHLTLPPQTGADGQPQPGQEVELGVIETGENRMTIVQFIYQGDPDPAIYADFRAWLTENIEQLSVLEITEPEAPPAPQTEPTAESD